MDGSTEGVSSNDSNDTHGTYDNSDNNENNENNENNDIPNNRNKDSISNAHGGDASDNDDETFNDDLASTRNCNDTSASRSIHGDSFIYRTPNRDTSAHRKSDTSAFRRDSSARMTRRTDGDTRNDERNDRGGSVAIPSRDGVGSNRVLKMYMASRERRGVISERDERGEERDGREGGDGAGAVGGLRDGGAGGAGTGSGTRAGSGGGVVRVGVGRTSHSSSPFRNLAIHDVYRRYRDVRHDRRGNTDANDHMKDRESQNPNKNQTHDLENKYSQSQGVGVRAGTGAMDLTASAEVRELRNLIRKMTERKIESIMLMQAHSAGN